MERHFAVILAADVAGFSRLVEADDVATLATRNAERQVIDGLVSDHRGRVRSAAFSWWIGRRPAP